jgi:hypothetical protein
MLILGLTLLMWPSRIWIDDGRTGWTRRTVPWSSVEEVRLQMSDEGVPQICYVRGNKVTIWWFARPATWIRLRQRMEASLTRGAGRDCGAVQRCAADSAG